MLKIALRVVLSLLLGTVIVRAAPRQEDQPADATVPQVQATIGQEEAQRRINELLGQEDVDEDERTRLVELYRQLVQRLQAEENFTQRAEAFRNAVDVAPAETAELRSDLAEKERAPTPPVEQPQGTSEQIQRQLNQLQAELANLRTQLAELDRRILDEEARTIQAADAEARTALVEIEAQLAEAPALGADATELEQVTRAVLLARQRARAAEVAMLRQEDLSRPARLDLLRARRDLTAWELSAGEARENVLETWLAELRQEEAERARREAERLRRQAIGKHELIRDTAAEVAQITRDTEELLPKIAATRQQRKSIEEQLDRISADFEQTSQSLDLQVTRVLGTVLLEQRRALPDAASFRRAASERSRDVADARLQLFGLERDLQDPTAEIAVERMLTPEATRGLTAQDRAELREELVELMATKRESLRLWQSALRDYLRAVRDLETQESALIQQVEELAALLDERLIWIPNAPPLNTSTFLGLRSDLAWLFSPGLWTQSVEVLRSDFERLYGFWVPVVLLLASLLVLRRRLRAPLRALAASVGKVRKDGIGLTLKALLLQVLYVMPVPAALVWVGWRLTKADGAPTAAKAVGEGLVTASTLMFGLLLLRALCSRYGVARGHFRWGEQTGRVVRRHLLWYTIVAVPVTFVVALTQAQPDRLIRHGAGRVAFILLMLAAAALAYFLLNRSRGVFVGRAVERASTWLRRSRPLWMPLGVLVPLTLAVLAATGYYYAALQIESLLIQTLAVILTVLFLHAFLLRWLLVSQRRLALKVALERRAAMAKKSEAGEDEEAIAAEGVIDALEEIDVVEIQDQTQDLLQISLGLFFFVAIWFAWVDVLPALGVLDDIPLWSHEVMIDGVPQQTPITLANLVLALLSILVTIAAARNMPGFLEIAVLQRLPLEAGARYASRTLALYTIVTVGIVVSFNAIGVGWSSVQWLLAALTVGLGFGLQEIFANFVSGLIILLERPIRVGDTVTVGEVSGVVSRIRMRATTITDWSRRELLVPNKSFITGELINWSLSDPILRMEIPVGIAYGSDTTLAHKTILKVCHEHPMVLDQPEPNVFFVGFGDNSLNFEARIFVNELTNQGRSRIVHDLLLAIDQACRKLGITIAFPQRDLHFKSSEAVLRVALEGNGGHPAPDAPRG